LYNFARSGTRIEKLRINVRKNEIIAIKGKKRRRIVPVYPKTSNVGA
jgi:hypothetical protein